MLDKREVLKQYFGHAEFRAGQDSVVNAILSGQDALCVMPTGAGKSVCYQVPAMMFSGVTVVISPLISLMKDQVNALIQNGISAVYINSSLTAAEYFNAMSGICRGIYKIIYVAPERLAVPEFLEASRSIKIDLVAVDEAHCISQWGQDFRPSYLKISEFIRSLGYRPIIAAFTATATPEVKDDIEYSLELRNPYRITTGFDRPNLKFEVQRPYDKLEALLKIIQRHKSEPGIVYCSTRKTVEEVGMELERRGFLATIYHAGLDYEVRKQNQEDFLYDRKLVMVATNAFGMGIDKSNVSFVVHYNMPKDIESYYQEAGRAGRDGTNAECILLYRSGDVHTNRFLIESSEPSPDLTPEQQQVLLERDRERLKQMTFYSTTNNCLRSYILEYFGEKAPNYCGNCSNCLTQFVDVDITVDAQKILSCIRRTGERFGKKMICDILRGSENQKIIRMGLDKQTTYGLMKEYKLAEVIDIIEFLELEEYIVSVGSDYPTLELTQRAAAVLLGKETLMMKQAKPREKTPKSGKKKIADDTIDRGLLAELKSLRRELADIKNVPAYIVFSDATLVDMCKKMPTTAEEMLEVSGVGRAKLEMYGGVFLKAIQSRKSLSDSSEQGDIQED